MIKYKDILNDYNNPFSVLRSKSKEVDFPLSQANIELVNDLQEYLNLAENSTSEDYRGAVGIAAPQIGKNLKIFAVNFTDENDILHKRVLINPTMEIIDKTPVYIEAGEGCLSVPEEKNITGYVPRNMTVKLNYQNIHGKWEEIIASYFAAIVYQHEYDHLLGKLYFDHINNAAPLLDIPGGIKL